MHDTNSEFIVNFYGAFLSDNNDVIMCMEYMDVGYVGLFQRRESLLMRSQCSRPDIATVWASTSGCIGEDCRGYLRGTHIPLYQASYHAPRYQAFQHIS